MDDLISKKEVENKILNFGGFNCWDDKSSLMCEISSAPSAFEGMTNGDVLKALFPIDENKGARLTKVYIDHEPIESFALTTTQKWLDSPYKGVSK